MSQGPGRRATLADVAARAGVSTALVSIVMREVPGASAATRERVLQAAAELGYRPDARARLLRSSRSKLIGVVFNVEQAFHADVVSGLYSAADDVGYELALSAVTPARSEQRATASLLTDRCEALILVGPQVPAARIAELASGLPVIVIARSVRNPAVDVVRNADAEGIHQAIDHLVALGHLRIAHIDGGRAPGTAERRSAYRAALQRHGLTDMWVVAGGPTEDPGAEAARSLLRFPRPTAVIAFNDRTAAGAMDTFRRAGLDVPGDVSVIGYDDSHLARQTHLNLTTVAQNVAQMAELAIRRAVDRVTGTPARPRELVVHPHLVIRSTTGPPPQAARLDQIWAR
jgi:DNA-binding LacI/PurR family transcriptional regulator